MVPTSLRDQWEISLGVRDTQSPLARGNSVLSLTSQQLHQHLTHLVLTQQLCWTLAAPPGVTGTEPCHALGTAQPWGTPSPQGVPGHCSLLTPFQQNKGEQEWSKSMLGVKLDYARGCLDTV